MAPSNSLLKDPALPFTKQNVEQDRHGEYHLKGKGSYLKTFVFGGLDGVLTIFAVVSGSAGASVSPKKLVSLSLGSLLASAFSMGYGEYVSSKAEVDYVNSERNREEYEIQNMPECEKREMFDIYTKRYNFSNKDASDLVQLSFKNPDYFLRHMMVEELGILLEEDGATPLKKSLIMGGSFGVMGLFPLVGYLFLILVGNGEKTDSFVTFLITVVFSVLGAATLGYFKGEYLKQNSFWSAFYMTFNAVVVGFTSYVLGLSFKLI